MSSLVNTSQPVLSFISVCSCWFSSPSPSSKPSRFLCFPPRLLIPGPLRAAQQTGARGSDDARLTPMSISSDLSYQPSSRLGRKIMNSSSAGFSFFFFPVHRAAILPPFCESLFMFLSPLAWRGESTHMETRVAPVRSPQDSPLLLP